MQEAYKAIGRVADQTFPVLITGESGTGKELVARAIYQHGPRAKAPFLALNCAAIPENLLESELFGHEKGSFTGADRRRIGKFEQCSGGTLFLDEIGDMPPATQAKMLRVLQEQTFERVGGNETIRTDVRLIAATHRDLKAWSEEGKFRPDLYYRLGVFTIHLPPLRERGDDLPLLIRHFLRRFGRELGRDVREAAPEALERLRAYPWPGNIRELQSVLKQALLRGSGNVLLPSLPPAIPRRAGLLPGGPVGQGAGVEEFLVRLRLGPDVRDLYAEAHRNLDRLLLPRVLEHTGGSQHQAALLLGIARQTLRLKLRDLGPPPRAPPKQKENPARISRSRARRQPHVPTASAAWVNVPINRANKLPRHIDFRCPPLSVNSRRVPAAASMKWRRISPAVLRSVNRHGRPRPTSGTVVALPVACPCIIASMAESADRTMPDDSLSRLVRVKAVIASKRGTTTPRRTS